MAEPEIPPTSATNKLLTAVTWLNTIAIIGLGIWLAAVVDALESLTTLSIAISKNLHTLIEIFGKIAP